ncbi:hypothetical protein ABFB09_05150 [Dehalogenimonas sp. THU2]|uniref:hypothetical protein n=1 Tax=Dehalogenimonas sp. THU2 TaxID=3151121 RepID=UPI003218C20B
MTLSNEYFLLAFLAAISTIQFAAGHGGFHGLMFSQNPALNKVLAILIATPAMAAFFTWNAHNPVGVVEGAQQAGLFSLASFSAVTTVLLLSSILNRNKLTIVKNRRLLGLEALKTMTFFQAVKARYFWKR